jgi:hypothetical protein
MGTLIIGNFSVTPDLVDIEWFREAFRKSIEGAGPSFRTPILVPICECGKETHGFANHSDWCDIYKLENIK